MKVRVWYANIAYMRDSQFPGKGKSVPVPEFGGLEHTHMELPDFGFEAEDGEAHDSVLDRAFRFFNWVDRDFTAPATLGDWLRKLEVGYKVFDADPMRRIWHSSMSVGDVVELDGIKYMCASVGWEKVCD